MLAGKLGIRLLLLVGKQVLMPAPYEAMTAFTGAQITNDTHGEDGFQMTFGLGKDRSGDFTLIKSGLFDPDNSVAIGVSLGAKIYPLIRGVIYHHQVRPEGERGSFLTVMGRDTTALMDLKQKDGGFANQTDSEIVRKILSAYASDGVTDLSKVTATTDRPTEKERVPRQRETDLACIRRLAKRNGFVFYLEPAATLGVTAAYWGAKLRSGPPQQELIYNLGPASNVLNLTMAQDPLAPRRGDGFYIDPLSRTSRRIPAPPTAPVSLARPQSVLKSERMRGTARFDQAQARAMVEAFEADASDAVTAEGELDTLRYGEVLRAHMRVKVSGGSVPYNGEYLVGKVTHDIEPGKYVQRFSLERKGLEG